MRRIKVLDDDHAHFMSLISYLNLDLNRRIGLALLISRAHWAILSA